MSTRPPVKHAMQTRYMADRRSARPDKAPLKKAKREARQDGIGSASGASNLDEEEDPMKDDWDCICGKTGRTDNLKPCSNFFPELKEAERRGERPWEHSMRKFEVRKVLEKEKFMWQLYATLSENNIERYVAGTLISGKVKDITSWYETAAEEGARALLGRMAETDVVTLHAVVVTADAKGGEIYKALLTEAERLREQEWPDCDAELGIWAELFGRVKKGARKKSAS